LWNLPRSVAPSDSNSRYSGSMVIAVTHKSACPEAYFR
jgi:hypothetical protein